MEHNDRRQRVQSVETGLRVLATLGQGGKALPLSVLAEKLKMPAAKLHRYLQSLIAEGFVEQNLVTGHYDLGGAALEIGLAALNRLDVVRRSTEQLAAFNMQVNETAFIAIWGNMGPTIVRWEPSTRPVTVNVQEGSVLPVLLSCTGRVFGAYLPDNMTAEMIEAELKILRHATQPLTPATQSDAEQLFAGIRAAGFATVRSVYLAGIDAVSAPIFDHTGRLAAVLTALGPSGGFDLRPGGTVIPVLRQTAEAISRRIGWQYPGIEAIDSRANAALEI